MAEVEMSWYVLRAVSGKEAKVKEYIDAEIKNGRLRGMVSQVLIPTEKVYQVRAGKRVVKERNYLPGYVLVEAKLVGEMLSSCGYQNIHAYEDDVMYFVKGYK